jgi:hypothetical protein
MKRFMSFLSFMEILFAVESSRIIRFVSNLSDCFNISFVIQKLLSKISCIKARQGKMELRCS